jgi:NTP pyrophosphatase (non-canonical NTP hydrolase)
MLKELSKANYERMKEWGGPPTSLSFKGNELAGEVGEACNILKKMERTRLGMLGGGGDIVALKEELADVIICVSLIANHLCIDLEDAIPDKFNKTSAKVGLKTRMEGVRE